MCGRVSPLKPELIDGRLTEHVELQENSVEGQIGWKHQKKMPQIEHPIIIAFRWHQFLTTGPLPESKSIWRKEASQVPQERGYRVWDTIWRRRPWDTSTWSQDSPPGGHRDHRVVIGKCKSTPLVDSSDPSPRKLPFSFCLSDFCCLLAANVALDQVPQSRVLFCHLTSYSFFFW